jgi:hypothetical protein
MLRIVKGFRTKVSAQDLENELKNICEQAIEETKLEYDQGAGEGEVSTASRGFKV